jgi:hypothetical protein
MLIVSTDGRQTVMADSIRHPRRPREGTAVIVQGYVNRLSVALHCPVIQSVERRISDRGMVSLLIVERYIIVFYNIIE